MVTNMFEISNGLLIKDGKPVIALGSHYYPSFHPLKVPVIDHSKRLEEAKKDIKSIKELGFSLLRIASIGESKLVNNVIIKDFAFVDDLVDLISQNQMSALVRIQGYSTNLRGADNALMKNQNEKDIPLKWDYFIRNCLNNKSVIKEDEEITVLSAKHFKDNKNVIGFQIYNEPAYPFDGFYDYNVYSVEAWKNKCHKTKKPPTYRPTNKEELEDWISFRKFSNDCINDYLVKLGKLTKEYSNKPAFTCLMPCAIQQGIAIRGCNMFKIAKGMDFLGITIYISPLGVTAREFSRVIDISNASARLNNTHAWAIECDARVDVSPKEYEIMILSLLAGGFKGILPYQYRADAKLQNAPEPDKYGIVYNDLTETKKFQTVKKMNYFINSFSNYLASSEALRQDVALYMSEDINIYQDAIYNGEINNAWKCKEPVSLFSNVIYNKLIDNGYLPRFVDINNLKNVKVLLIPSSIGISDNEKEMLKDFELSGGVVRVYNPLNNGFETFDETKSETLQDLMTNNQIMPIYQTFDEDISLKILKNEKEYLVFVINHNAKLLDKDNVIIELPFLNKKAFSYEICYQNEDDKDISFIGEKLILKHLTSGIIIRLRIEE